MSDKVGEGGVGRDYPRPSALQKRDRAEKKKSERLHWDSSRRFERSVAVNVYTCTRFGCTIGDHRSLARRFVSDPHIIRQPAPKLTPTIAEGET